MTIYFAPMEGITDGILRQAHHRIFGGVDETQVWTKIRELNDIYQRALTAERARYDALLAEQKKGVDDA